MKKKLKVDLHTHTAEDPCENIDYTAFQLIDKASQLGFDALAISNHDRVTSSKKLEKYAEEKGVLLIPGMEASFSRKHVLIINPDFEESPSNRPLKDLLKIKNEKNLIIAPHPFFPTSKSLRSDLFPYLDTFDAIEFSHFYNHFVNNNKKAEFIAHQYEKPLIATSDCHFIWQFGTSYTLVEAEKKSSSIIQAIKKGKIKLRTSPLSLFAMCRTALYFCLLKPHTLKKSIHTIVSSFRD